MFLKLLLTKTHNNTFRFQNINENTVNDDILEKLAPKVVWVLIDCLLN